MIDGLLVLILHLLLFALNLVDYGVVLRALLIVVGVDQVEEAIDLALLSLIRLEYGPYLRLKVIDVILLDSSQLD